MLDPVRAVIFDLDGVIRHFAPSLPIDAEHALAPGTVESTAFETDLVIPAITGAITHQDWFDQIETRLIARHGSSAAGAAMKFAELPAIADSELLALSDALRSNGYITAVLTNGTTRVEAESERLGITEHFDYFFNSARIGYAKPDRRVFEHAVAALGMQSFEVAFTDDSEYKLSGAIEIGIHTHQFTNGACLRDWLRSLALPVD